MISYARVVRSLFGFMEIRTGNIVPMNAISKIVLGVTAMTNEQMQNEVMYQGTMLVVKQLLKKGIISDDEYEQIDTMFRQKYAISLSTLFTDIRLIKFGSYGNIAH